MTRLFPAHTLRLLCALCMVLTYPTVARGYQGVPAALSEGEVISGLTSRNAQQLSGALVSINKKVASGGRVSKTVRSTLIKVLADYVNLRGAASDGKPYYAEYFAEEPHEAGFFLTSTLIALEDEAAIPVLLQTVAEGFTSVGPLLSFGPMVVEPALECAENDESWTMSVYGCTRFLGHAVYMWRDRLSADEVVRLQTLIHRRLSKPRAAYPKESTGPSYAEQAARLALVFGWTDEYRALAHARMEEIDPGSIYGWYREAIQDALTGKTLATFERMARARQR